MYAKIENGVAVEYPLYEGDLERRFPQYIFPLDSHLTENNGVLCPEGYARVSPNTTQIFDRLKNNYELGMPVFVESENIWKETWVEIPLTNIELEERKNFAAFSVREERNKRLNDSDKFVMIDRWEQYTPQQKLEWTDYRRDLRNIPEQSGFPYSVEWPIDPSIFSSTQA